MNNIFHVIFLDIIISFFIIFNLFNILNIYIFKMIKYYSKMLLINDDTFILPLTIYA